MLKRFRHGARAQFMQANETALYGGLPAGSDISQASAAVGKQRLAEMLSGTTDKKSRSYKTARDYISRHLAGRRSKVIPEFEQKITRALRANRRTAIRQAGSITAKIVGEIQVSKKAWGKGGTAAMSATLSGTELDRYIDALDRGDGNSAMGIFLDAYGIDRDVAQVNFIRSVEYQ